MKKSGKARWESSEKRRKGERKKLAGKEIGREDVSGGERRECKKNGRGSP